ncbi:MAG: hypothetical protein ABW223_08720 [Rariglobus sp.]
MPYPEAYSAYLKTLPFLGRVTSSHHAVTAGAYEEILVTYEVGSAAMADGAWLKLVFKFYSDWAPFQTTHASAANYLSATYVPRETFPDESPATVRALKVRFDQKGHERPYQKAVIIDIVDGYLKPGDKIEIRLGDRRFGGPGTRVQTFVEEVFRFRVFVDTAGASRFSPVPGDITLAIRAGAAANAVLLTPRLVRPGIPFSATFRVDDAWGNLASINTAPADALQVRHEGKLVSSHPLSWSDHSGAWAQVNLVLAEAGDYEISAGGAKSVVTIDASAPTVRAHFADLHVHSEDTVGINDTRYNLSFARDAAALDVVGYTANDFNVRADRWADAVKICRELNTPGSFLCFPGTEWCGSSAVGGDRNVIFLGDEVRFPLDKNGKSMRVFDWNEDTTKSRGQEADLWSASELHNAYRDMGENVLLIPHVGGRRAIFDWHDGALERLVEIASSWGHFDWFYKDALARGHQVGASAAGDEHRGRPGGGAPGVGSFGTHGGVTGFIANEITAAAVGHALRSRHTWATTGRRAVALLSAAGHQQGDAFHHSGPLMLNYDVLGDAGWERIELRDDQGTVLHTRDFDAELGHAPNRFRVRWGGARIKDRYRWAEWRGIIEINGTAVKSFVVRGCEHPEETVVRTHPNVFEVRTDTYGDADHVEFEVEDLSSARIDLHLEIDAYNKTGPAMERNRDPVTPGTAQVVFGADLLAQTTLRWDLGGAELFVAVERVTDHALPLRVKGSHTIEPANGPHGHRSLYLFARERDDHKVWTSPLFVTFPRHA